MKRDDDDTRRRARDRRDDRAARAAQRRRSRDRAGALRRLQRFDADASSDVAVLTGAGGAFCAGADLEALAAGETRPVEPNGDFGPMGPTRLKLGKPVIAAIEGPAVAGGMELALWCDLRIAARSAVFGFYNRRFGVPLIDLGTIRLPRIVGHGRALELILTGRTVGAEEALRIGLVNEVTDDGQALAPRARRSPIRFHAFRRRRCATTGFRRSSNGISAHEAIANEVARGLRDDRERRGKPGIGALRRRRRAAWRFSPAGSRTNELR